MTTTLAIIALWLSPPGPPPVLPPVNGIGYMQLGTPQPVATRRSKRSKAALSQRGKREQRSTVRLWLERKAYLKALSIPAQPVTPKLTTTLAPPRLMTPGFNPRQR